MKKVMIVAAMLALLCGCEEEYRSVNFNRLPDDFKDCKIAYIKNSDGIGMYIARCVNSTTTVQYPQGKTQMRTITVDGMDYQEKEKK